MKFHKMLRATTILVMAVLLTTAMRPLAPLAPLGATINVNIFIDEYNDTTTGCSLREAVQSANNNADFGGCKHSGTYGHDTILLMESGTYSVDRGTEPSISEDANVYGDLDILPDEEIGHNIYDVTIEGNGADDTIIDGNTKDRIIDIQPNAVVKLVGIQIYHGQPAAADGKTGNGCGIYNHGTLRIEDSIVAHNSCRGNTIPAGVHAGDGGGIWSDGELTIINTTINNNYSAYASNQQNGGDGAGIFIASDSGTVTITNSTITYNTAGSSGASATSGNGGRGAGIFNAGEDTHLESSVVYQNFAGQAHSTTGDGGSGGGIFNSGGTLTIINTTLYFNSSGMSEFATSGSGAGLANNGGEVNLHESTLAFNRIEIGVSYGSGGGIESSADSTTTTLHNTLISWNNRYNAPPEDADTDCHTGEAGSNVFEARYSLIHNMSDCSLDVNESNLIEVSPYLGPFGYHGGPTKTIPLRAGSPGIDDGDPVDCPATDQRGYGRPADGDDNGTATCDIGAYEYQLSFYLPMILK